MNSFKVRNSEPLSPGATAEKVRSHYTKAYSAKNTSAVRSPLNPAILYSQQARDRALTKALRKFPIDDWSSKKVLDVGCGGGFHLMELMRFGADPNNLYGVDILPERIDDGRRRHPSIHFQCANSERLPFGDAEFDVVMQYTTFVAIELTSRFMIAREMTRVLKPGGLILWYDFRIGHPFKKEVRGISRPQLKEYFPGLSIWTEAVMLPPPFARLVARFSTIACEVLEKLPLLCSAYFAVLRKPPGPPKLSTAIMSSVEVDAGHI